MTQLPTVSRIERVAKLLHLVIIVVFSVQMEAFNETRESLMASGISNIMTIVEYTLLFEKRV